MAYGGTPDFHFSGPGGVPFKNWIKIDGLILDSFTGGAADIANPDTGELTTAAPGANQTGLPANFARVVASGDPGTNT